MRFIKSLCVVLALSLSFSVQAEDRDLSTPEANAQAQIELMKHKDWQQLAAVMDPTELAGLKEALIPAFNDPDYPPASDMRKNFLGVETTGEVVQLEPKQFYAALLAHLLKDNPSLDVLVNGRTEVLGHVMDGNDVAYVVYRLRYIAYGKEVSEMDIISTRRSGSRWLGLMRADVAAFAPTLLDGIAGYKKKHPSSNPK